MNKLVQKLAMVATVSLTSMLAPLADAGLPFELGAGVDLVSHYVWRGQLLTDDPVVQPYVEIGIQGLTLEVWGSIDTTDINEDGGQTYRIQEIDYTLSYGISPVEGVDLEAGVIHYDFPGTGDNSTQEVYVSAALSEILLEPTLTVYYDINQVEGVYASLGIGHSFKLTEKLDLSLEAGLGWADGSYNDAYFGVNSSALNDASGTVSLDYEVNEIFSISAFAGYSALLDSGIKDSVDDSDNWFAGAGFYFSY